MNHPRGASVSHGYMGSQEQLALTETCKIQWDVTQPPQQHAAGTTIRFAAGGGTDSLKSSFAKLRSNISNLPSNFRSSV